MPNPLVNPGGSDEFPPQPPTNTGQNPPANPLAPPPVPAALDTPFDRPADLLIAPRTNGIIDYSVALMLFLAPWILSYTDHAVAPVSRTLGAMVLFYSLCTKYDLGVVRFIPLQVHLFLDLGMALLLVAAPIHFAIWGLPGMMMVLLGMLMGAAGLLTRHGQKFNRPAAPIRHDSDPAIRSESETGSPRL